MVDVKHLFPVSVGLFYPHQRLTMSDLPLCPFNSKLQNQAARARVYERPPRVCLVTGGTGFVGQRLVEMLVERGAERVISFDIVPPHDNCWKHEAIEYVVGDISDTDMVDKVCEGVDCVWHIAAAVGPFHPQELYVNAALLALESVDVVALRPFVLVCHHSTSIKGAQRNSQAV